MDASITKRMQVMKERLSGVENVREEIDCSVKENVKYKKKKILTQNIQRIWEIMKRWNLRIIVREFQLNGMKIYPAKIKKIQNL